MTQSANLAATPPFDNLTDWLAWQESSAPVEIELGLNRCRTVATAMEIDCGDAVVITVAGTNGKGSSVTMLENVWLAAGYSVAAYTSPHMLSYNERIRFAGVPIAEQKICAAFENIETHRADTYLTYFEYGTLAALKIFQELQPDIIILEVGLGGRLDAVNIIDADVALITSIGIDHVEFLGSDRESIGFEKAGIMRAERPAVCSDPHVPQSVMNFAAQLGAKLACLGVEFRFQINDDSWDWWNEKQEYLALPNPNLVGDYQFRNAAGVLQVIDLLQPRLPVSRDVLEQMLQRVQLWGRFQRFPGSIEYIFDVAHNVQAIEQFVATLAKIRCAGKTHLVLGMLKTKDRSTVIKVLQSSVDKWYLASVNARRGASADELSMSLQKTGSIADVVRFDSVIEALSAAREAAVPGDRIIALGSFLVVSDALKFIGEANDYASNLTER